MYALGQTATTTQPTTIQKAQQGANIVQAAYDFVTSIFSGTKNATGTPLELQQTMTQYSSGGCPGQPTGVVTWLLAHITAAELAAWQRTWTAAACGIDQTRIANPRTASAFAIAFGVAGGHNCSDVTFTGLVASRPQGITSGSLEGQYNTLVKKYGTQLATAGFTSASAGSTMPTPTPNQQPPAPTTAGFSGTTGLVIALGLVGAYMAHKRGMV